MGNFYTDVIQKDPRFNSTERIEDPLLLEPGTRAAVQAIIADLQSLGHDARVLETYRSEARQHMLFEQHLTQLSKVGVHGFGLACDIALYVSDKYDPVGEHYVILVPLAQKHGMISGINWGLPNLPHSFKDYDHIQRIPLFRQNALFAGSWYPPTDYDPHADEIAAGVKGL